MKNQYFGDNRDLFKYDLAHTIIHAKHAGLPSRFTFIPMLTKDEERRKEGKPGTKNRELVSFLNACTESQKRNIRELEAFFKDKITIYKKDDEDKYFSHGQRKEYFEQVPDKLLKKSLILVDPDTGLGVNKSGKEHILYCEVKSLYDRMDRSSILMIFQVFPRDEKHEKCLSRKSKELRDKVRANQPIYIHDGKIIFFFLARDNKLLRESLIKVIREYRKTYDLRVRVT